ncbi:MAG: RpiB/LacA/LacB family sugar-phosphate isomerase, partial [Nitrospiria bacterium]
MKLAIASDHAGLKLKNRVIDLLKKKGIEVKDFGTD